MKRVVFSTSPRPNHANLKVLFPLRFEIHHAGMTQEELFADGSLKVLAGMAISRAVGRKNKNGARQLDETEVRPQDVDNELCYMTIPRRDGGKL